MQIVWFGIILLNNLLPRCFQDGVHILNAHICDPINVDFRIDKKAFPHVSPAHTAVGDSASHSLVTRSSHHSNADREGLCLGDFLFLSVSLGSPRTRRRTSQVPRCWTTKSQAPRQQRHAKCRLPRSSTGRRFTKKPNCCKYAVLQERVLSYKWTHLPILFE